MPFFDAPGYEYGDPQTYHSGNVEVTHGPNLGDYNLGPFDIGTFTNPPVHLYGSYLGSGIYQERVLPPPGPFPDSAASDCIWYHSSRGHDIGGPGVEWGGTCPDILATDPSDSQGSRVGSGWVVSTPTPAVGVQIAHANAFITGWLVSPWNIYDNYSNPWMGDDDLEAEVRAIEVPDGWFLQWENYFPTFVGYQIAPDERVDFTGLRTEAINWYYDPDGWGLDYVDQDNDAHWITGDVASGTILTTYSGGASDWLDPPAGFPVAEQDPVTGRLVAPDDYNLEAKAVSGASASLYQAAGTPTSNGTGGRDGQTIVTKAIWTPPRYRFFRALEEVTLTTSPPRRLFQRGDGATHGARSVVQGRNTRQNGNRTVGAIL